MDSGMEKNVYHTIFTVGSTYVTWFFLYIMSEDGANTWSLKIGSSDAMSI